MADYRILLEADTAKAEKDLKRVETVADAVARNRKINVSLPNFSGITDVFTKVKSTVDDATKNIKNFYNTAKLIPGVGQDIKTFEEIFINLARGAGMAAAAFHSNNTAGKMLGNVFAGVGEQVNTLINRLAVFGFAMSGLKQIVGVLQGAFGGFFNETIGREIKLRESMLQTQTTVASLSKVFVGGKELTDPLQKIEALSESIEKRIESIRERSLDLAGVTSEQVINVFDITAAQIGQIGGGLKEAEDLAISFAGALGTFNIPLYQAQQEITSILTGTIDMNSLLAKALGITNEKIAKAKTETGGVYAFLQKALETAVAGQKIAARSWSGVTSNIVELQQLVSQKFGKGLLEPLLNGLSAIYSWLSSIKNQLFSIAETAGKTIGTLMKISTVKLVTSVAGLQGSPVTTNARISESFKAGADALQSAATQVFAWLSKAANYAVSSLITAFNAMKPALAILADSVRVLIKAFAEIKAAQFEALVTALANLAQILAPLVTLAASFVRAWAGVLDLPIVQYFTAVQTQLNLFKRAGGDTLINMVALLSFLKSTGVPVLQMVIGAFGFVVKAIAAAIAAFGQLNVVVAHAVGKLSGGVAVVLQGMTSLITYFQKIGTQSQKVGSDVAAIGTGMARMGQAADNLGNNLTKAFQQLGQAISTAMNTLKTGVAPVLTMTQAAVGRLKVAFTEFGTGAHSTAGTVVNALRAIWTAVSQLATTAATSFKSVVAAVAELFRALGSLGTAFTQLQASLFALGKTIVAPFIAFGQAVMTAAQQIFTALDPVLTKVKFTLNELGVKAQETAAKLGAVGVSADKAGLSVMKMGLNFVVGMAKFAAFQFAIGIIIDLIGKYQRAQQDAAKKQELANAIRDLAGTSAEAATNLEGAAKATYEYKKALVDQGYQKAVARIQEINKELRAQEKVLGLGLTGWEAFTHSVRWAGYGAEIAAKNISRLSKEKKEQLQLLKELDKLETKRQQDEAQAYAASAQGKLDALAKEVKATTELANLEDKLAQNNIRRFQLQGRLTDIEAKRQLMYQQLGTLVDQLRVKQEQLSRAEFIDPANTELLTKLRTEVAELDGQVIQIQIQAKTEAFEQAVERLSQATEVRVRILEYESRVVQNTVSLAQQRIQAEVAGYNNVLATIEVAKQYAETDKQRIWYAQQALYYKQLIADLEYQSSIIAIRASIRQAEIEEKKSLLKLAETKAMVEMAKAQGLYVNAHGEALRAAQDAYNISRDSVGTAKLGATYQMEIANFQREAAYQSAAAAYVSEKMQQYQKGTAEYTQAASRASGFFASQMERAAAAAARIRNLPIPSLSGVIPGMASGGYVTRPTIALIGEGGEPEYVIPESKMAATAASYLDRNIATPPSTGNNVTGTPIINISTGPVMELNGQRYVTLADMERAMRITADSVFSKMRTPAARVALGIA